MQTSYLGSVRHVPDNIVTTLTLYVQAAVEQEPYQRMKTVVQWYLSGFYKKPKGLKKPYNPILGETFRCYWEHENGSKTVSNISVSGDE